MDRLLDKCVHLMLGINNQAEELHILHVEAVQFSRRGSAVTDGPNQPKDDSKANSKSKFGKVERISKQFEALSLQSIRNLAENCRR